MIICNNTQKVNKTTIARKKSEVKLFNPSSQVPPTEKLNNPAIPGLGHISSTAHTCRQLIHSKMSVPTNITREYDHLHWWPHLLEEHLEQGKKQPGQFYRGNMVQQTHGLTVDTKARVTLLVATLDTRWCQLHLLQRVCDGFCAPIFAFPKLKFGFL